MGARWGRVLLFASCVLGMYAFAMFGLSHAKLESRALIFRTGDYYNWPGGDSWTRFHEFDRAKRYDAIIIGSSHAYRGYDPEVFAAHGHHVYNLGSSAQSPLNTFHLIKNYVDSAHCPLLIFDVFEGTFQNTGLESCADLTQNITSGAAALGMAWDLRELRGLNMMALRWCTPGRRPYYESAYPVRNGFVAVPDSVDKPIKPLKNTKLDLLDRQKELFQACVKLCRERGIRLVVAQHQARQGTNRVRHEAFAAYIRSELAGTGIPFLDFAFAPGLNDLDHFADHNHLNAAGARIFTGQLVDSLEALGYMNQSR